MTTERRRYLPCGIDSEKDMSSECRKYCLEAIELSEKLTYFSQNTHYDCDDDNCLLLSDIILDSVYKIRLGAEKRRNKLEAKGQWSLITSHTKDQEKS